MPTRRNRVRIMLCAAIATLLHLAALAQPLPLAKQPTIPALLLSDLHFDPFHDPAKVAQLDAAPASQWHQLLATPDSPDQAQAFASLQKACGARTADTSYALLQSSLQAIHTQASAAAFVTISGDLLAHQFHCRYTTTLPNKSAAGYEAFTEKTLRYLVTELKAALPSRPIYIALGNNDTSCADYQLDPQSSFLLETRRIIAEALPPSQRKQLTSFAATGGYNVALPSPLRNTRLIVLDDLFESRNYKGCNGKPNPAASAAQLAWLRAQLEAAHRHHQKVWVLGHIPPGVDVYATYVHMTNVCGGAKPTMFLGSDELPNLLVDYAGTIQLALFGHTHMDEIHLLTRDDSGAPNQPGIALKMVPSITPVNGNNPAFTIATISTSTSRLIDYRVIAASNSTGIDITWSPEYTFSEAYHQPEFSAITLKALIADLQSDTTAKTDASQAYIHSYFVGDKSSLIKPLWPQYACSLGHYSGEAFTRCVCALPQ